MRIEDVLYYRKYSRVPLAHVYILNQRCHLLPPIQSTSPECCDGLGRHHPKMPLWIPLQAEPPATGSTSGTGFEFRNQSHADCTVPQWCCSRMHKNGTQRRTPGRHLREIVQQKHAMPCRQHRHHLHKSTHRIIGLAWTRLSRNCNTLFVRFFCVCHSRW
jgi:hypothetical protein